MITWLWIAGTPAALFAIGIGSLTRLLHRQGWTWAGSVACWRMRRRPAP